MKKPRIALVVHLPLRDLSGLVLTALELCKLGATAYLVPSIDPRLEILSLAPDFVLMPGLRPHQLALAKILQEAGVQFGVLDTEGSFYPDLNEYISLLWQDRAWLKKASLVCMWGPKLAGYLIEKGVFEPSQIVVTGSPRFDLSHHSAPSGLQKPVEKRNVLLFNANFVYGNPESLERVIEGSKRYGIDRDEILRRHRIQLDAIDKFMQLANSLAKDFPERQVIVRPHPEEPAKIYEEKRGRLPNISVDKSGDVYEWIARSLVVIQRSCTTSIDAGLRGVPSISPTWIPAAVEYPEFEAVSLQRADYESVVRTIRAVESGQFCLPQQVKSELEATTRNWLYALDGLSALRVARAIMSRLENSANRVDPVRCIKAAYGLNGSYPSDVGSMARWLKYLLKVTPRFSFRKFDVVSANLRLSREFGIEDVSRILEAFAPRESQQRLSDIQVRPASHTGAYLANISGRSVEIQFPNC